MSTPILATKLYIPPPRPELIVRPRLIERLDAGLPRKLTLISAPAGFGKTTLVSSWIDDLRLPIDEADHKSIENHKSKIINRVAWLSLDEGDNDPARLLAYVVAAIQTIAPDSSDRVLGLLYAPQSPPTETILTALLNEISTIPDKFVLVLDDYHVIETPAIDQALAFYLSTCPPRCIW